ncbi:unnamed protein product [Closterium sp. Naga37s-1]|nr:unnamed protein product [Closterium sp. Naga37s-1]
MCSLGRTPHLLLPALLPLFPTCPSPAMLALKSSLGVTYTTWAATTPCQLAGSTTTATVWNGVLCDTFGSVVSIRLHYNYLYGDIPSFLVGLPKLSQFGAVANYFTGSVPALATGLRSIDLRFNFITDVPAVTYTYCGGNNNCLLTPSKCSSAGSVQMAAADCAFCGTTNGVAPFCPTTGGVCTVDAATNVAAGTLNSFSQPVIARTCVGGFIYVDAADGAYPTYFIPFTVPTSPCWLLTCSSAVDASSSTSPPPWPSPYLVTRSVALLSIKAAMGLTTTTWAATTWAATNVSFPPCSLSRPPPFPSALPLVPISRGPANHQVGHGAHLHHVGVLQSLPFARRSGQNWRVGARELHLSRPHRHDVSAGGKAGNLDSAALVRKSFPSDITKLTAITYLGMPWNFLDGSLADYLKDFSALTNLKSLAMQYMFFSGSYPSVLTTLPLGTLALRYNYLTGTLPASITSIKSLDISQNFFVGSLPTGTWSFCSATKNCLASAGNCQNNGQRSACGICGTTDGTGTLCGLGQTCLPDADAKIAAKQNNYISEVALVRRHARFLPPLCPQVPYALLLTRLQLLSTFPCANPANPTAAAMQNIKTALGVTLTTWTATAPCRLTKAPVAIPGEWTGVFCTEAGKVSDISLQSNLLNYRLDSFTTNLGALPLMADIGVAANYLMGSVPALATGLRTVDLRFNFLTDLPAVTYTWCGGNGNCLLTPSKCASDGSTQRAAADCAFCTTTNGVGPFCWGAGGVCTVDAAAAVAAGTVSSKTQAPLGRACVGGPMADMKDSTGGQWAVGSAGCVAESCTGMGLWVWAHGHGHMGIWAHGHGHMGTWTWAYGHGLTDMGLWTWAYGDGHMDMGTWRWAYGHGHMEMGTWRWAYGHGHMDMSTWRWAHGDGHMEMGTWRCAHGHGHMDMGKWTWAIGHGQLDIGTWIWAYGHAMLGLKASLGVTFTTWAASVPCQLKGQTTTVTVWNGVLCDSNGTVFLSSSHASTVLPHAASHLIAFHMLPLISLPSTCCLSSHCLPHAASHLIAFHMLPLISLPSTCCLSSHCLPHAASHLIAFHMLPLISLPSTCCLSSHCLPHAASHLIASTTFRPRRHCSSRSRLHYNYLFGDIPSFLVGLPKLTEFGAVANYFTGSVPAVATGLRSIDLRFNFITDVPAVTYTYCGGNNNCLLTPSKCSSAGSVQRAAADCAFCGTTNGAGPLCPTTGGVCTVDAATNVAAGTLNSFSQPVIARTCVGGYIFVDAADGAYPPYFITFTVPISPRWSLTCSSVVFASSVTSPPPGPPLPPSPAVPLPPLPFHPSLHPLLFPLYTSLPFIPLPSPFCHAHQQRFF